ncbi:MAG: fibronectin type III domain-containing protein [Candidatus Eisenbacteria sp.]|nr:fibronectin type III domain-containing protein [Candidatus Eisenbacteria bacterium]
MMRRRHEWPIGVLAFALLAGIVSGCSTDTEEPSFSNPFDPALGADRPAPDSVAVAVGDGVVRLSWTPPAGAEADEYALFRARTDLGNEEDERLLDRVTATTYADARVQNGGTYAYRIATGRDGRFGPRSDEVSASPGLFSILLQNDTPLTRSRSITVSYSVVGAQAVRLSEDPDLFTAPWHSLSGSIPWTLSAGDATKTVYARFRFWDGSESIPVFDSIVLDTKAVISGFGFTGTNARQPGETIHFQMVTGETNGTAQVTVAGVFDRVTLLDDGTHGDATAADGTYERDLVIPAAATVHDAEAVAAFTDEAGNAAAPLTATELLTIRSAPEPVTLFDALVAEPPSAPSVTLRWERAQPTSFAAYRLFRSESAAVDSTDELVYAGPSIATVEFVDTDVVEGLTYAYRLYLQDTFAYQSGSNAVQVTIANLRPPDSVTLHSSGSASTDRIALDWSEATDRDFQAYQIYRNTEGAVSDADPMRIQIDDVNQTYWDDTGLQENTTYYYRVYTRDQGGLAARSNEIEATSANEPPAAVTLEEAAAVDSTAATLTWTASNAHDFACYRLYRDEIATVTTASTLVVEIDTASATSFRDTELEPETRFHYRVFVIDDADEPGSTGSNTITLVTL